MPFVVATAIVFVVIDAVLVVLILGRGWWVDRRRRRHDALVSRLRRSAVTLVEGDETATTPELDRAESQVFAELLTHYRTRLHGEDQQRIVDYFETSGAFDEQLHRLDSRMSWHRASAAFLLGDMGSARATSPLVERLDDSSPDVRAAAARSLGHLGALDAIEPIITAGVSGRIPGGIANLALLDIGPPSIGRVTPLLDDPDPRVRAAAVRLLGLLGAASDADQLLDHMSDPAAPVRSAAASALGRLGASEARDALVRALDDRVPAVRTAAAEALGQIGGRHAVDALIPIAQTDVFDPARAAAEALGRIDQPLVVRLAAETGASPHVREAADRALL